GCPSARGSRRLNMLQLPLTLPLPGTGHRPRSLSAEGSVTTATPQSPGNVKQGTFGDRVTVNGHGRGGRGAGRERDEPRQGDVPGTGPHQARRGRLLPPRRSAVDERDPRAAGPHAAVPERRRGFVVLPEARAEGRARVARDVDREHPERHDLTRAGRS